MASRIKAETVLEENEEEYTTGSDTRAKNRYRHEGSFNLDETLRSFEAELDDITQSMENDDAFNALVARAKERVKIPPYRSASTPSTPKVLKGSNRRGQEANTISTTPVEPSPMKTPAFLLWSSPGDENARMMHSNHRPTAADTAVLDLEQRLSQEEAEQERTTAASRLDDNESNHPSSMLLFEIMRETMQRQEDRIRFLEHQNEQLLHHLQEIQRERHVDIPHYTTASSSSSRGENDTYSMNHLNPYTRQFHARTTGSPSTSPHRNNVTDRDDLVEPGLSLHASPGSRFVEELSQIMEIDPKYQTSLADIMDKHFARAFHSSSHSYR